MLLDFIYLVIKRLQKPNYIGCVKRRWEEMKLEEQKKKEYALNAAITLGLVGEGFTYTNQSNST
jgi:hypothetical protein